MGPAVTGESGPLILDNPWRGLEGSRWTQDGSTRGLGDYPRVLPKGSPGGPLESGVLSKVLPAGCGEQGSPAGPVSCDSSQHTRPWGLLFVEPIPRSGATSGMVP